ncbi:porin [Myroides odoratimimus]|uniref:porin n=1 Tax=Myroides odoratimimus TaxID=76832 RepID=UPI0009134E86|nr:porin [Myroides odoratimimus]SHL89107.1 Phosphate-selective porin O and P [Myroides odoratimimus subsp. xuanwuensis]
MNIKYTICAILLGTISVMAQDEKKEESTLLGVLTQQANPDAPKKVNTLEVYLDSKYENLTKTSGSGTSDSKFRLVQSRVYLKGNYNNKLTYSLRYRLNESVASNALEFAFLEYNIDDHWTVGMGKQFTAWGSTELSYNSTDLYMFTNIIGSIELFSPGASVAYKVKGQSFKLQMVSQGEQFVAEDYKNKAYGGLFLWEGELFKKHLKTRYGYALFQHDAKKYYSWVTMGNRLTLNNFMAEVDWMYGFRNVGDAAFTDLNTGTKGIAYVKDNVTTASVKYKFHKVTPYVKVMYNYRKDLESNVSYALKGVSTAIEYNPFNDKAFKDLRLFAAYNFLNYDYKNYEVSKADKNEHQIAVGVRWMVPLFKL